MDKAAIVSEDDVQPEIWSHPVRGEVAFRTIFGDAVAPGDLTAGVMDLDVGGWLGLHRHDPAEIYYVLAGEGTLNVGGEEYVVRTGTTVYIPSNSEHAIRNTGNNRLRFFFAFPVASFSEIEYHFLAEQ